MEHGKSYQAGSGRRLTNKKILIITAVAGFVLVGSVCLTVALIFILRPATSTPTAERLLERLSESVRENMDQFANPCDDFYRYSCGGWNRRNPIPSGASSTSRFAEVNTRNIESLRDAIEGGRDNDVRAVQLARQLYDSCTNTRRLNDLGSQPLAELIKNTGGWNLIGVNNGTSNIVCTLVLRDLSYVHCFPSVYIYIYYRLDDGFVVSTEFRSPRRKLMF